MWDTREHFNKCVHPEDPFRVLEYMTPQAISNSNEPSNSYEMDICHYSDWVSALSKCRYTHTHIWVYSAVMCLCDHGIFGYQKYTIDTQCPEYQDTNSPKYRLLMIIQLETSIKSGRGHICIPNWLNACWCVCWRAWMSTYGLRNGHFINRHWWSHVCQATVSVYALFCRHRLFTNNAWRPDVFTEQCKYVG